MDREWIYGLEFSFKDQNLRKETYLFGVRSKEQKTLFYNDGDFLRSIFYCKQEEPLGYLKFET